MFPSSPGNQKPVSLFILRLSKDPKHLLFLSPELFSGHLREGERKFSEWMYNLTSWSYFIQGPAVIVSSYVTWVCEFVCVCAHKAEISNPKYMSHHTSPWHQSNKPVWCLVCIMRGYASLSGFSHATLTLFTETGKIKWGAERWHNRSQALAVRPGNGIVHRKNSCAQKGTKPNSDMIRLRIAPAIFQYHRRDRCPNLILTKSIELGKDQVQVGPPFVIWLQHGHVRFFVGDPTFYVANVAFMPFIVFITEFCKNAEQVIDGNAQTMKIIIRIGYGLDRIQSNTILNNCSKSVFPSNNVFIQNENKLHLRKMTIVWP